MSADRLREAARVLRERAEAAEPGPWAQPEWSPQMVLPTAWATETGEPKGRPRFMSIHGNDAANAAYIATVHPEVGKALADWLDHEGRAWAHAEGWGETFPPVRAERSTAVADAILGGAS